MELTYDEDTLDELEQLEDVQDVQAVQDKTRVIAVVVRDKVCESAQLRANAPRRGTDVALLERKASQSCWDILRGQFLNRDVRSGENVRSVYVDTPSTIFNLTRAACSRRDVLKIEKTHNEVKTLISDVFDIALLKQSRLAIKHFPRLFGTCSPLDGFADVTFQVFDRLCFR